LGELAARGVQSDTLQKVEMISSPSAQRSTSSDFVAGSEFSSIIAESEGMRHALRVAQRVAPTELRTLLLTGEAGTGKELLARCIHIAGLHPNAPFISINCGSIPAPLLELELFGRVPTRADPGRRFGALELAEQGTVFLDEVSELPLELQHRLVQTLEEYSIPRRNGAGDNTTVHCRVIAASKTRLDDRVASGTFREDLLGRVALRIELPPLRERNDDAHLIADHFLRESARLQNQPRRQLGPEALEVLRAHRWPGNVRELKHVIDCALATATGSVITVDDLVINQQRAGASAIRGATTFAEIRIPGEGKRLRDIEREALELTLQLTENNQSATARMLCISRPTLARKLKAYGLDKQKQ
jgi:DNA-binding NtrC family response regulator